MGESVPGLIERVGIEVLGVEPALPDELGFDAFVEVGPQALRLGRMMGEERVGLDVQGESARACAAAQPLVSCSPGGR